MCDTFWWMCRPLHHVSHFRIWGVCHSSYILTQGHRSFTACEFSRLGNSHRSDNQSCIQIHVDGFGTRLVYKGIWQKSRKISSTMLLWRLDKGLLKKRSLVSSSFLLPSRKQLFSRVTLRSDRTCQETSSIPRSKSSHSVPCQNHYYL